MFLNYDFRLIRSQMNTFEEYNRLKANLLTNPDSKFRLPEFDEIEFEDDDQDESEKSYETIKREEEIKKEQEILKKERASIVSAATREPAISGGRQMTKELFKFANKFIENLNGVNELVTEISSIPDDVIIEKLVYLESLGNLRESARYDNTIYEFIPKALEIKNKFMEGLDEKDITKVFEYAYRITTGKLYGSFITDIVDDIVVGFKKEDYDLSIYYEDPEYYERSPYIDEYDFGSVPVYKRTDIYSNMRFLNKALSYAAKDDIVQKAKRFYEKNNETFAKLKPVIKISVIVLIGGLITAGIISIPIGISIKFRKDFDAKMAQEKSGQNELIK